MLALLHDTCPNASAHKLQLFGATQLTIPLLLWYIGYSAPEAISLSLWGTTVYLITLFSSIVIYRLSPIHPLACFPGPRLAKVTQLWKNYHNSTTKLHEALKSAHRQYGYDSDYSVMRYPHIRS